MSITTFLLTTISVLTLLCVFVVVFVERKNPTSSIAWIMVLLFLPIGGFILYLFLGSGFRINKRRKFANKAAVDDIYNNFILKHLNIDNEKQFRAGHGDAERLLNYLEGEGEGVFTNANQAEIFTDGNDFFPRLLDDINAAQKHIHLLFYIFRNDRIGGEIVAALGKKAREGVEVRLVYDSVGSLLSAGRKFKELAAAGGHVAAFAPILTTINSSLRLNYRNHRKIVVVDGVIGYVGGMNVGDEYMSRDPKMSPWRDTQIRLIGQSVWFLQERFLMDWSYARDKSFRDIAKSGKYFPEALPVEDELGVQIVSSGPDAPESAIKCGMLTMIYSARKHIHIQSPYLAPDQSITDALSIAAKSGIDVKIMIPRISDHWIVHRATYGYARQLVRCGVKILQYDGFLHAKTIVADGLVATIGTANMTNRSFTQNFEVNAFVYNADFAGRHDAIFRGDEERCVELDENWFETRRLAVRASYNFSRLLSPLI